MGRVVSSDAARAAAARIQMIISEGLAQEIRNLENEGRTLSDPTNWDGGLAVQFRSDLWPRTKAALDNALAELDQLSQHIRKINTDIMAAGGSGS
jgi:hypothetical protein